MHVVLVEFTIRPDHVAEFAALVERQAEASLTREPGCRQFDVAWADGAEVAVVLYEIYDSAEAFEAHLETEHFRTFDRESAPMIAAKSVRRMTRRWP